MASETSWLEQMLIALSQSDINLLNEHSTLAKKLHSVQKCSDEDLMLLLADKRKTSSCFKVSLHYVCHIWTMTLKLITEA